MHKIGCFFENAGPVGTKINKLRAPSETYFLQKIEIGAFLWKLSWRKKGLVRNVDRDLIYFCQERKRRIDKCCCKMFISSCFLKVVKDLLLHMFTVITSFISSQRFINIIHCVVYHFCSKFTVSNKFENPTFLGFLVQQHPFLHNTRNFSVTFGEFSFSYKRTKFSPWLF